MNSTKRRRKEKLGNFRAIPTHVIKNRITAKLFLFMTEPVSSCPHFEVPFIQSVKEQIFIARTEFNALKPGKGYKRSNSMAKRAKKLKANIKRLSSYFINSTIVIHPDGRNSRRLQSKNIIRMKIPYTLCQRTKPTNLTNSAAKRKSERKTRPSSNVLCRQKRRRPRPPRKVRAGPLISPHTKSQGLKPEVNSNQGPATHTKKHILKAPPHLEDPMTKRCPHTKHGTPK